jgi:hypothetical protein
MDSMRRLVAAGLLLPGLACAQYDSVKSAGSFTVQVILTADAKALRESWNASDEAPRLETTSTVTRGKAISAMLVVHGCATRRDGRCDAVVEFALVGPEDKRTPGPSGVLWNAPVEKGKFYLSDTSLTMAFDGTDPLGAYRIVATATDRVARRTVEVSAPFTLR